MSIVKWMLCLCVVVYGVVGLSEGVSLEKTARTGLILSRRQGQNLVAERSEHQCLLSKARTLVPVANNLIRQLKPRLLSLLKSQTFRIPSPMKGLTVGPIQIDHVNFRSASLYNRGNGIGLKISGISLRIKRVSLRVSKKILNLFLLQINKRAKERKLFMRTQNSAKRK